MSKLTDLAQRLRVKWAQRNQRHGSDASWWLSYLAGPRDERDAQRRRRKSRRERAMEPK